MEADELVALYLLIRRISDMKKENNYRDHPFRERLRKLMFSANQVQGLSGEKMAHGAEHLIKLADYFGVSTDYLLGREGYETEENKWS